MTRTVEGVAVSWDARRALFSLDPRLTHLNHGSFGAAPLPVQRAQQRLRDEMEANPMAFFSRGLLERIAHTRTHLATFMRAEPSSVALVPNATAAANAILRSARIATGDEILLTDHGYGAVQLAAQDVAERAGATVRVVAVPLTVGDDEIVDRVVGAARPGRTRLAIVDHVTSPTARLLPVDHLVAELRARDVLVAVDAAHGPGMLDVDITATDADYWFGNLHKWAFAPRPTALLAVRPEHRAGMRPLVTSWEQPGGFPLALEFAGTLDYTPWLAAPAGLHFLRTLGTDQVRSHNNTLALQGQRLVAEALASRRAGGGAALELAVAGQLGDAISMRPVPLPPGVADEPETASELRTRLATEHGIEVAIGVWNGMGLLRLSAQIYNQIDDYDRLGRALGTLLRR